MAQIYRRFLHWAKGVFHSGTDQNENTIEGEIHWSRAIRHYMIRVGIRPTSCRESEKLWRLALNESGDKPDSLNDGPLALSITPPDIAVIRGRLDAILFSRLSAAIKEEINALKHTSLGDAPGAGNTLYLDCLLKVSTPHSIKGEHFIPEHDVDNILLYGDRDKLDTNLVITRKEIPLDSQDRSPLPSMILIHRTREFVGRKSEIFGICTDSYQWNFMHINKKRQVSESHSSYKPDVHASRSPVYPCTGCMISTKLKSWFATLSARQLSFIEKQLEVRGS
ncbi:hypothetical protein AO1008_02663 [Aspergillus oryzae 100-8]|uniref:Uncharacterized protein n=1 Tax=Aspergillus oryzae (strain 3.042) TaxID=1160506 RepID=I8U5W7_ASPO3|nr:hypothetical protein Ao3042_00552 [Aspergillus oryzae 3.042]KDE76902.1 hypothetical protein AO1008_02663 [Aspergillus oryzae 100-8]|eukprot:EIT82305.1 hypothetical protein Ao3042_00552 [Aspergillus oryzae 3.042]